MVNPKIVKIDVLGSGLTIGRTDDCYWNGCTGPDGTTRIPRQTARQPEQNPEPYIHCSNAAHRCCTFTYTVCTHSVRGYLRGYRVRFRPLRPHSLAIRLSPANTHP
jgi:hypothetical protein